MSRIPRISKIYKIDSPHIGVIFTNGEYKILNLKTMFQKIGIKQGQFGFELLENEQLFNSVEIVNRTLSWKSMIKKIDLPRSASKNLTFEIDPVTIYKYSKIDPVKASSYHVGRSIKNMRNKLKLSQDDIAQNIGSNKQYVSRIENDKSDLEFNTLKRIYELGFNRKVFISHFDESDFLNTYSNSIFSNHFISWIEKNNNRLDLIEGIGKKIKHEFEKENITSTKELANLPFDSLIDILKSFGQPFSFYHFPESWAIQAKYLQNKDWINLLKLQRMLKSKSSEDESSKIEIIAKKETKHHLFEIE